MVGAVAVVVRCSASIATSRAKGLNLQALLAFSAVFGFGGAFISLLISKWMAKRAMGVQVITQPANETERWLVNVVAQQAQPAGIGMPEVGIFDSPEPNAFATGANKNSALVAVSTGLLRNMRREEVEAVLGHEVSHVANGDMVTLTLIQGVMNTFVFFLARVIGCIVDKRDPQERARRRRHRLLRSPSSWRRSCWASSPAWSWPGSRASVNSARTRVARISRAPTR